PSSHLILCHPLLLLPSIFPSNRVFSNESGLYIRWPKYWSFSFSITLTGWTFVGKVMSLLFNMLSRLVITFLPRSKRLLISWLQSPSAVILEPKKINSLTVSIVSSSICHEVMGPDAMILVFRMKAFLYLLAILWNSAYKWVYFSFSPLPLVSLFFSAVCKNSSDNHTFSEGKIHMVKNPQEPAMQEMRVQSLGWDDPMEEGAGQQRWWEQEIKINGNIQKGELITYNLTELIKPEAYEVRLTPLTKFGEGDSTIRVIKYSAPVNPHLREFHCGFEDGNICLFTQDDTDNFDWTKQSTATRNTKYTPNTGPNADRSGSKEGVLNVYLRLKGQTTIENPLWSSSGNKGQRWNEAHVNIYPITSFQLIFEGIRGPGIEGDIAIDDVSIAEGECAKQDLTTK
ncbi:hypothetical protein FD755_013639, partial [Muntiacus reevesi]